MKIKCDFDSEVDKQQLFSRRFVVLADIFETNEGEFVAIIDRDGNNIWFVSQYSADSLCDILNNLHGESLSFLATVSCDAE